MLKLLQRQVAQQLGVNYATITNWETTSAQQGVKYMPGII
jgi:DNA-binding XRE family transcriptional regulator